MNYIVRFLFVFCILTAHLALFVWCNFHATGPEKHRSYTLFSKDVFARNSRTPTNYTLLFKHVCLHSYGSIDFSEVDVTCNSTGDVRIKTKELDNGKEVFITNASIKIFNCTDLVVHAKVFGFSISDRSALLHYLQYGESLEPKAFTLVHIENQTDVVNYDKYKKRQFSVSKFTDKTGMKYYAPRELNILEV